MQTGVTTNTGSRLVFDAGAVYLNYTDGSGTLLGATRGGATFTIIREDREVEVDGMKGPTKGLKRATRHHARLEVTFIELTKTMLYKALRISSRTAATDGSTDYHKYLPDTGIVDADYATNISLLADSATDGEPYIIKLLNALAEGDISIQTGDQNEAGLPVTFMAHYSGGSSTVPYEIWVPQSAS